MSNFEDINDLDNWYKKQKDILKIRKTDTTDESEIHIEKQMNVIRYVYGLNKARILDPIFLATYIGGKKISSEELKEKCEILAKGDFFINGPFADADIDSLTSVFNDTVINGVPYYRKIINKNNE